MHNSLNVIYRNKNYKILDYGKEYIIYNTKLEFANHHTHIANYNTCKYIIKLCINKTIPDKNISDYLLNSILRISDDESYKNLIKIKIRGGNNNGKRNNLPRKSNRNNSTKKR